ncbi:hypothetical protein O181_044089 [Austropuccinia psidii MF-1]|uniref:Uncharacterized protein n=1 Tax=Austropuccinia psidii MF-1 TaxID=1389203 RepID=A0A9Q3DJL8_9BASI|nr:hypothetical protein [Austropuccinia psidii MF-1]
MLVLWFESQAESRCVEPCSTEDYTDSMEYIINQKRIGRNWSRNPMVSNIVLKTSREYRRPEIPIFKLHKCGRTSPLANNHTKNTKINEFQFIEEVQCAEEKEESDHNLAISDYTSAEHYPIEKLTDFFEVTKFHTQFAQ